MKCSLNERIDKKGYKKKWMAEKMGVSTAVMSRWCANKATPSLENALTLAELLECRVEDLWQKK
ncbi:helix-turn-helix domain-containing protein [Halobacillus ihumii]|uniref:helix-turn-helix transcriptional regulator n=1 Tax=Halobacillus ihumii TaxID=2686092 RepID=UPI0013D321A4